MKKNGLVFLMPLFWKSFILNFKVVLHFSCNRSHKNVLARAHCKNVIGFCDAWV